jgi:hypothetical protein
MNWWEHLPQFAEELHVPTSMGGEEAIPALEPADD